MVNKTGKYILVGGLILFTFFLPFGMLMVEFTFQQPNANTPTERLHNTTNIESVTYDDSHITLSFDGAAKITPLLASSVDRVRIGTPETTRMIDYAGNSSIRIPADSHGLYRVTLYADTLGMTRSVTMELRLDDAGVTIETVNQ